MLPGPLQGLPPFLKEKSLKREAGLAKNRLLHRMPHLVGGLALRQAEVLRRSNIVTIVGVWAMKNPFVGVPGED